MSTETRSEFAMPTLAAIHALDAAIADIKSAFGAPGDWGYGTKQGDALFALYRARADLTVLLTATDDASESA